MVTTKINNKPLSKTKKERFEGSAIGEEWIGEEENVEYICPQCRTNTIITLKDKSGNTDLFCKRCSSTYNPNDDTVRHKTRFDVPRQVEPAVSIVNVDLTKDVEIRHTPPVRGGLAELQKRGLKITNYRTTEKE